MKYILPGILVFILFAGIFLLFKEYYVKLKLHRLIVKKYSAVKPLMAKLSTGQAVTTEEILFMSQNPSLRLGVFWILHAYSKGELFPTEYLTHEKAAESFLVSWLEFPTEVGMAPAHIELFTKVTLEDTEPLDYYVFKFSVNAPHWDLNEWMIGTCGPYTKESSPYDVPIRVFSRFNLLGSISPESEAQWVHKNISKEKTMKNMVHMISLMY